VKAIDYFWNKQSPKKMSDDLKRYIIRRTTKNPDARFLKIIPLKGGHDFDKDYTYLFEQIEQHLGNDYFSPPAP